MRRRAIPPWLDASAAVGWRLLVVGAVLWGAAAALSGLFLVIAPVFLALLVAALLSPAAGWLRDRGWSPGLAAITVLVGGVLVVVGAVLLVGLRFSAQVPRLMEHAADVRTDFLAWVRSGPFGLSADRLQSLIDQAAAQLRENQQELLSGLLGGTVLLLELVSAILLALVLAFFFLRDGGQLTDWTIARLFREDQQEAVGAAARTGFRTLSRFVRGVAIIGAADAIGVAIGLLLLGVPLVIPLSLLVFVGAFVPIVGAFVAGLVAVVVATATGGLTQGLLVLGLVVLVEQLEGNILQPAVMGRELPLHPVVVLLALTAGGVVAGVFGALAAVPTAAALSAAGHELRVRGDGSGDGPPEETGRGLADAGR